MDNKIDSNIVGLSYAEEESMGVLGAAPKWYGLEPNTYPDFGGNVTTVARNPINRSRQRKKGVVTDLDATGGFNHDFVPTNLTRLLQGFFFADIRQKPSTAPLNAAGITITGVTAAAGYAAAAGLNIFGVSSLVYASNFDIAANNGLKKITSSAAGAVDAAGGGLVDEVAPPADAMLELVGHEFVADDITISVVGGFPRINSAAVDLTTLGLISGEWIFLGGDAAGTSFAVSHGFARVKTITADYIDLDKTSWTPQVEASGGKTIRMFFGNVIRNEPLPANIKRRTYQLERTLGEDDDGTQSEYLVGSVANTISINNPQANKVNIDFGFTSIDAEQRDGAEGLKNGTRINPPVEDCFNTSSDFSRIKLAKVDPTGSNPTPLFAFATDMSISITNNVSPNKALGVLGAFNVSVGTFDANGKITAYFADVAAVQAVRNNADITLDLVLAKANKGVLLDMPLISLGGGRVQVVQDKPIMIPLDAMGAESVFGHTLLFQQFPYLPNLAM